MTHWDMLKKATKFEFSLFNVPVRHLISSMAIFVPRDRSAANGPFLMLFPVFYFYQKEAFCTKSHLYCSVECLYPRHLKEQVWHSLWWNSRYAKNNRDLYIYSLFLEQNIFKRTLNSTRSSNKIISLDKSVQDFNIIMCIVLLCKSLHIYMFTYFLFNPGTIMSMNHDLFQYTLYYYLFSFSDGNGFSTCHS